MLATLSLKNSIRILVLTFISIYVISCKKEENKSSEAELLSFSISSKTNFIPLETVVDHENKKIVIFSTSTLSINDFPVKFTLNLSVSPKANVSLSNGQEISFTDKEQGIEAKITSEDGKSVVSYWITIADNQIPNSNF